MTVVHAWHPDFQYYEDLVGIECVQRDDIDTLIEAFSSRALRTRPCMIIGNTMVFPRDALTLLYLGDIEHTLVELRQSVSLDNQISSELHRRYTTRNNEQPHYYITGCVCCLSLVLLSTVREIEKLLQEHDVS